MDINEAREVYSKYGDDVKHICLVTPDGDLIISGACAMPSVGVMTTIMNKLIDTYGNMDSLYELNIEILDDEVFKARFMNEDFVVLPNEVQ